MKGCIIERNGSLRLKVSLGKNHQTGKYESYYETFHGTKTEARKRLRQILTELDNGVFVKPGKVTVAEYLQIWLEDYCKIALAPRTHQLLQGCRRESRRGKASRPAILRPEWPLRPVGPITSAKQWKLADNQGRS